MYGEDLILTEQSPVFTCFKFIGVQRSFLSYEFCGFGFLVILNLMSTIIQFVLPLCFLSCKNHEIIALRATHPGKG